MKELSKGDHVRHAHWRQLVGVVEYVRVDAPASDLQPRIQMVGVRHDDGKVLEYERSWLTPIAEVA